MKVLHRFATNDSRDYWKVMRSYSWLVSSRFSTWTFAQRGYRK